MYGIIKQVFCAPKTRIIKARRPWLIVFSLIRRKLGRYSFEYIFNHELEYVKSYKNLFNLSILLINKSYHDIIILIHFN